METRNTPSALLPILLILAMIYPVATILRSPGPGGDGTQAVETIQSQGGAKEAGEEEVKRKPAHDAATLLSDFFGPAAGQKSFTAGYQLDFIIATVPDPFASRLPYFFDSFTDSIQRGAEAADYVLDRFDLPWTKSAEEEVKSTGKARFETEPGLMLFRHRQPDEKKLLLIFVVGETPTTGIHKLAFTSALDQITRQLHGWRVEHPAVSVSLPARVFGGKYPVKILGPSFSGSAVSMKLTLDGWLKETTKYIPAPGIYLQIVSGTATAMNKKWFATFEDGEGNFQATVPPDPPALGAFLDYLKKSEHHRIALLAESNTVYGQFLKTTFNILTLPFPLHISKLRAAAEKVKQSRQAATPQSADQRPSALPLPQEEAEEPREIPPGFSPLATPSADLVLSNLLSTISREQYQYVGILATDVQDTIFLAEQIHEHCPATVTFTFNPDLLYTHPEASPATQGMLMITPYPLFSLNQVWTSPFQGAASRLQFPNQAAVGVYNATLALLDQESKAVEYGIPFDSDYSKYSPPAVWVTVVGRKGMLPITYLDWENSDGYSKMIQSPPRPSDRKEDKRPVSMRGVYTQGITIAVIALSICFILFSGLIVVQYSRESSRRRDGWVSRLIGDTLACEYQSRCRLFLLAACIIVLAFYIVVIGAFFLPILALRRLTLEDVPTATMAIVASASALAIWMFVLAIYRLAVALKSVPWPRSGMAGIVVWTIIGSCTYVLLCALWLVKAWTNQLDWRPANLLFTFLRAFSLSSGFSPIVPLFCITAAGFLWATGSFRRMRLVDGLQPTKESKRERHCEFLSLDGTSFEGIRALEGYVEYFLSSAAVMSPFQYVILFTVAASAASYSFRSWLVMSIEAPSFYWLFEISFFLVYWALLMEFLRLVLVWRRLKQFMRWLSWHPMRAAFKRYRDSFPSLPKINMMSMRIVALECSVEQARRLLSSAKTSGKPPELPEDQKPEESSIAGAPVHVEKKLVPPGADKGRPLREVLEEWARKAESDVAAAGAGLADALVTEARGMSPARTEEEESKYNWRESIRRQREAQDALARITRSLGKMMEPYWAPTDEGSSATDLTARDREFFALAEDYIAGRAVHFLSYIFPSLKNLAELVLGGLLLMLLAVTSYSFPARDQFLLFNWIVILIFIGVAGSILVQMERDVVLSALNGTTPGQVTMNREFVFRLLLYVVLPMLALLGAQFPDTLRQLVSAVSATQGGRP